MKLLLKKGNVFSFPPAYVSGPVSRGSWSGILKRATQGLGPLPEQIDLLAQPKTGQLILFNHLDPAEVIRLSGLPVGIRHVRVIPEVRSIASRRVVVVRVGYDLQEIANPSSVTDQNFMPSHWQQRLIAVDGRLVIPAPRFPANLTEQHLNKILSVADPEITKSIALPRLNSNFFRDSFSRWRRQFWGKRLNAAVKHGGPLPGSMPVKVNYLTCFINVFRDLNSGESCVVTGFPRGVTRGTMAARYADRDGERCTILDFEWGTQELQRGMLEAAVPGRAWAMVAIGDSWIKIAELQVLGVTGKKIDRVVAEKEPQRSYRSRVLNGPQRSSEGRRLVAPNIQARLAKHFAAIRDAADRQFELALLRQVLQLVSRVNHPLRFSYLLNQLSLSQLPDVRRARVLRLFSIEGLSVGDEAEQLHAYLGSFIDGPSAILALAPGGIAVEANAHSREAIAWLEEQGEQAAK